MKDNELSHANCGACTRRSNRNKPSQETPAGRVISTPTLVQPSRVRILLMNTYDIMKNARPFVDLAWMCRYGYKSSKLYPRIERKQIQLNFPLIFGACFFPQQYTFVNHIFIDTHKTKLKRKVGCLSNRLILKCVNISLQMSLE